jgi:hypothetical protein
VALAHLLLLALLIGGDCSAALSVRCWTRAFSQARLSPLPHKHKDAHLRSLLLLRLLLPVLAPLLSAGPATVATAAVPSTAALHLRAARARRCAPGPRPTR